MGLPLACGANTVVFGVGELEGGVVCREEQKTDLARAWDRLI